MGEILELDFGLGALASEPDERDFPFSAFVSAGGVDLSTAYPAEFRVAPMPPVLNQHKSPMCVAYSSACMKMAQDRTDGPDGVARWYDFDEPRFFRWIGGTDRGAMVRWAMEGLRKLGYPLAHAPSKASEHRIASYYAIDLSVQAMQAAIMRAGVVVVAGPWHAGDFHPIGDVLSSPAAGPIVGGHARARYGWRTLRGGRVQWLTRNSWGPDWAGDGSYWEPAERDAELWEAWAALDVPAPTIYRYGAEPLKHPRKMVVGSGGAPVFASPKPGARIVKRWDRGHEWTPEQAIGTGRSRMVANRTGTKWVRLSDLRTSAA